MNITETTDYTRLVKSLLQHATIANFEYWSEFIIRIERDARNMTDHPDNIWGNVRIPPMFCLRLRNTWWVGTRYEWDDLMGKFPVKHPPGIPRETPLQASVIVGMLGSTISDLSVSQTGDLDIFLSNGQQLHVKGAGGQWDESWFLELPIDDPDRDKWSMICMSEGAIYVRSPLLNIG